MKRTVFTVTTLVVLFAALPAALAEPIDDAVAKIAEAAAKHKAVVVKSKTTQDLKTDDFAMKSEGESTVEYKRVGEKGYLSRMESRSRDVRKIKGQDEEKQNTHMLMVVDGKYNYVLTESGDDKRVMKRKLDPKNNPSPFDVASGFKDQARSFTLKLLPDDKVDGKECWVIEAKPKDEQSSPIVARMVVCYCKKTGIALKTVSYDASGRQTMSSIVADLKLNPDLADERFTFKVPDGVQVIDLDALQKGLESEPSDDKTEPSKTEARPSDGEKPAEAAPETKQKPKKEEKKKGIGGLLNKIVE